MNPAAGGPCQGIRNSIPALSELGVHNEVVTCDSPDAAWLGSDSFLIHTLGPGKFGYAYSPRLLPWLIENLPRFDVVIVHGLWLWPSIATHIALKKLETSVPIREIRGSSTQSFHSTNSVNSVKKVPRLFVFPHGMLDPYFQRAPERRIKAIRNWIYWKLAEHRVINNADGILFTCEEEKILAREPFRPYKPKREIVVKYGTPEPPPYSQAMREAFAAKCNELNNQPYILFLSRIHPKKGVDLLIRAYSEVKLEAETGNLKPETSPHSSGLSPQIFPLPSLVIAGPCHDPEYLRNLKAEAGRLKPETCSHSSGLRSQPSGLPSPPPPSIHFVDMLTGDAKWGALYGCEAFILPSHQENFGIAVAEALACGKPILISNKVNIWREIKADGAGIVEDDTLEGTKNLLHRFCNSSPATNSLRCFQNRFTIEQAAKSLFDAIRETTDNTNSH